MSCVRPRSGVSGTGRLEDPPDRGILERWEVGGDIWRTEMEDVLWVDQALEAMQATVVDIGIGGQGVADEFPGGAREQDLAAMTRRKQPRHLAERETPILTIVNVSGTRVQRHADPQRADHAPRFGDQGALRRECRNDRIGGFVKGGTDGITDGLGREGHAILGT